MFKQIIEKFSLIFIVSILAVNFKLSAEETKAGEEVLSPYFIIMNDSLNILDFPLLKNDVKVNIAGVIADVTITQTYKNDGTFPVEAVYVFPASENAAVYYMEMKIGDRTIVADIKEKEEARRIYQRALEEGRSASLLEQLKPNIFKMNVANILPGDVIEVSLKYTELLKPVNKIYSFVYPKVVGPRYNEEKSNDSYNLDAPEFNKSDFRININLQTGMELSELECISHNAKITPKAANEANIIYNANKDKFDNKDFVIKYKLAGDKIETGLLVSENGDEKFFTLIIQPPARPEPEEMPAREYIFVMDVSGSMSGKPLTISKKLMINLIKQLRSQDKFNLIQFASSSNLLSDESISADQKNIEKALEMITEPGGSGGTNILDALKRIDEIKVDEKVSRSVIIVTDGFVNVETKVFDFIRNRLDKMNVFAFGIGVNVNRYIIEGIARVGEGEPSIITNMKEADYEAERFEKYISSPVMTSIIAKFEGFLTYDVEPKTIPDVFADRPIIMYGKWDNSLTGNIKLEGITADTKLYLDIDVRKFAVKVNSNAIKYLWARNKLLLLSDYASIEGDLANKEEIIDLSLKYNLLSKYTSFIAVDSEIREYDTLDNSENIGLDETNGPDIGNMSSYGSAKLTSATVPTSSKGFVIRGSRSNNTVISAEGGSGIDVGEYSQNIDFNEDPHLPVEEKKYSKLEINIQENDEYFKYPDIITFLDNCYIEIKADFNFFNKIDSLHILRADNPNYILPAKKAFRKYYKENKEKFEDDLNTIKYFIPVPDQFKYKVNDKIYDFRKLGKEMYMAEPKEGYGQEIKIGDNVEIEFEIYNQESTLVDSGKFKFMAGIGEAAEPIDKLLIGKKKQGEFILILSPYMLNTGKPYYPINKNTENIILKIKISDLEIE